MTTFRIQTLSECTPRLRSYTRLRDPYTAILASIPTVLNLFSKAKLSITDLDAVFPGNGYWSGTLKQYLLQHIAWKDEALPRNIDQKMKAFIQNVFSKTECIDLRGAGCFQVRQYPDVYECDECTQRFANVLEKEKVSGGNLPSGKYPGGLGGSIDMQTVLLIGGGIFLIAMLSKKKKRRK